MSYRIAKQLYKTLKVSIMTITLNSLELLKVTTYTEMLINGEPLARSTKDELRQLLERLNKNIDGDLNELFNPNNND